MEENQHPPSGDTAMGQGVDPKTSANRTLHASNTMETGPRSDMVRRSPETTARIVREMTPTRIHAAAGEKIVPTGAKRNTKANARDEARLEMQEAEKKIRGKATEELAKEIDMDVSVVRDFRPEDYETYVPLHIRRRYKEDLMSTIMQKWKQIAIAKGANEKLVGRTTPRGLESVIRLIPNQ